MKNQLFRDSIRLKANLYAALVILAGFLFATIMAYRGYYVTAIDSIEKVSGLTSESIYYRLTSYLAEPVNVSRTMASDRFLINFLHSEESRLHDAAYIGAMRQYLKSYQEKYEYDSVFIISSATARYYNFNGFDRVINPEDDKWYYHLLYAKSDYGLNVGSDLAKGAGDAVTVFVNAKIFDGERMMGTIGVGKRLDSIQKLFRGYEDEYGVRAYLIDKDGLIHLSAENAADDKLNLYESRDYDKNAQKSIAEWQGSGKESFDFWRVSGNGDTHVVVRNLPHIGLKLIVERDTGLVISALRRDIAMNMIIVVVIAILAVWGMSRVMKNYRKQIVALKLPEDEIEAEPEKQSFLERVTNQLFEDIYVTDITNNRPGNEASEAYFERYGVAPGTSFDQAIRILAEKNIKIEYRQGYINMFSTVNVKRAFAQGTEELRYDFLATDDGENYRWMRIIARIVDSEKEDILKLVSYRQCIDEEKRREKEILSAAYTDDMTGLLRRRPFQQAVAAALKPDGQEKKFAFLIFDIDDFKQANENFGHQFGDAVIKKFAAVLRTGFLHEGDIIGRLGGDEFAAFLKAPSPDWAAGKAAQLVRALNQDFMLDNACWHISASIGIAFYPENGADFEELYRHAEKALYQAKSAGKSGYALYDPEMEITEEDEEERLAEAEAVAAVAATLAVAEEATEKAAGNEAENDAETTDDSAEEDEDNF